MAEAVGFEEIHKIYPDGNAALRGVTFSVESGEIHGILGENGAGKTTLMRILYGEIKPTAGKIRVFGREMRFSGPWDAIRAGIGMVYQRFSLIGGFTVSENLVLSALPLGMGASEVISRAGDVMSETGLRVSLDARVEDLPVGERQRVEIIKALVRKARILVLDEPTSVLTPLEVRELFKVLRRLRDEGMTILFITHKLREVKAITDRVTVLRRGRVVGTVRTDRVTELDLARMMVGREVLFSLKRSDREPGDPLLEIRDLRVPGEGSREVRGVSLTVRSGEILGIAGVQGNGQRELVEAIAGMRRVAGGRVILRGEDVTNLPPSEIYRRGLAYIPDMRSTGLVMDLDLVSNLLLTRLEEFSPGGLIRWGRASEETRRVMRRFNVVAASVRTPAGRLSGGNQQKFMLGREISREPDVIVAAEPTQGLDVGATEYVRRVLMELRDSGKAVMVVSTDLDEIMQLSDRVAVMYEGRIIAQGPAREFDADRLGLLMGGVEIA